jgi:hypothetical protein
VLSGLEAVVPDWEMALEEQPRLWQQVLVRRELEKQRLLVDEIKAIARFDDATIQALRKEIGRKKYLGEVTPDPEATTGPATITNQQAFERYRSVLEGDHRDGADDGWQEASAPGSYMWAMWLITTWMARYTRRQAIVAGTYGRLADTAGVQALMARNRVLDGAETAVPDWGAELQQLLEQTLQNEHNGLDVTAYDRPHTYGPSLRCLWLEGQRAGRSGQAAWRHILTWARHRPAAWEVEDRRKAQGLAYTTPALGALLARPLDWQATGDPEQPWAAEVDGARWRVRLGDFPDDFMYSLLVDGQEVGSFHDWPETWRRD